MGFVLDKEKGYFQNGGVDVMVFEDTYPEGHQSGISIIMHSKRIATNGDVRFEPTPGQWQPVPKQDKRELQPQEDRIAAYLHYPDETAHLRGFNPRIYPDFAFGYEVTATAQGESIVVTVHLHKEIPDEFAGKLCFNMELFPGELFGKSYIMDEKSGVFSRQPNGPSVRKNSNISHSMQAPAEGLHADIDALCGCGTQYSPMAADDLICEPYAVGHSFTLCPEDDYMRINVTSPQCELKLYDGRFNHNNGWFVLSSELPQGKTRDALEWVITPGVVEGYIYKPVIQLSNVGYHPSQHKKAVIELDEKDDAAASVELYAVKSSGRVFVKNLEKKNWGKFLRYNYITADFSEITEEGLYIIKYKESVSQIFRIAADVYERGVWQPVMEYFLPVQMCHMRVNEKYRVWHGLCHEDDARMAPTGRVHFDGYIQDNETLTKYAPGDAVPSLNAGGWHDAGDFDLRVESQSGEAYILSLICEEFGACCDSTLIDQQRRLVEIHEPDGINDFHQQIEHGLLSVLGGYKALGRLYRGIICGDLRQYVMLGDASCMTDGIAGNNDDRWVFTENNPVRELYTAAHLAACGRVIKVHNKPLAEDAVQAALELFAATSDSVENLTEIPESAYEKLGDETAEAKKRDIRKARVHAAAELYLTTGREDYLDYVVSEKELIISDMNMTAHMVAKVYDGITDESFKADFYEALRELTKQAEAMCEETPYGVPYKPYIWGAGWSIQAVAFRYYFLHKQFPELFGGELLYNALNFILGTHPGVNNASFASGVGTRSATVAYGANRADWSYIPGGVVSGTALIRPDFPELLEFPYLWQQTEYVLGGGSSNYMFLVFAVLEMIKNNDFPSAE